MKGERKKVKQRQEFKKFLFHLEFLLVFHYTTLSPIQEDKLVEMEHIAIDGRELF